ncbi:hypothetical protein Ait01nite_055620 [Actinoplanes italicus]|nr:hypothetical protein Ait01nite_055620 [Actinoplanes italicus]
MGGVPDLASTRGRNAGLRFQVSTVSGLDVAAGLVRRPPLRPHSATAERTGFVSAGLPGAPEISSARRHTVVSYGSRDLIAISLCRTIILGRFRR